MTDYLALRVQNGETARVYCDHEGGITMDVMEDGASWASDWPCIKAADAPAVYEALGKCIQELAARPVSEQKADPPPSMRYPHG